MLNRCDFIGRMAADGEIRYTQAGTACCNFRIAVSEKWKGQDGQQQEKTEWVSCVAWKRLAEIIAEYGGKGLLVYVSGKFQTRKWQDKDGNDRYTSEIVVNEFKMLEWKKYQGDHAEPESHGEVPDQSGDIPF